MSPSDIINFAQFRATLAAPSDLRLRLAFAALLPHCSAALLAELKEEVKKQLEHKGGDDVRSLRTPSCDA